MYKISYLIIIQLVNVKRTHIYNIMVIKIDVATMRNKTEIGCSSNILDNNKTKKRKINFLLDMLKEYCCTSTIHGIGYLGANDKSLLEKIWWLIMFLLSLTACSYLITKTWIKWKTNPVILSFEKEQTPIWAIPFPAVTVCPLNKIEQKKYNYTQQFRSKENLTEIEKKIFWDISLVCSLEQYYEEFRSPFNTTDEKAIEKIRKYAPQLEDTIGGIRWQNKDQLENVFADQITQDGLCYTFNTFSQQDMYTNELNHDIKYISHGISVGNWSLENGYSSLDVGPRRAVKDGSTAGLNLGLFSYTYNTDYVCGVPISGYKIILHNPAETPKTAQQYFLVPLNRKVTMIVRPDLTTTSPNLRSLSPQTRKCYFSDEKSLRFFKVYTQNNCRVECDANVTKEYCGCVPFYMPRDNNTLICAYGSIKCVREIETTILELEMSDLGLNKSIQEKEKLKSTKQILDTCQCLPACTSLYYTSETSQTEIHMVKSILQSGIMDEVLTAEVKESLDDGVLTASQVDIFFKESQFLALSRNELYGQTDFLANCGGLLGLFMGVSILSLLEIVYFLTLRFWFKYRSRSK